MRPTEGVLTEAWELYRSHWQHFAGIALTVFVVISLVGLAAGAIPTVVGAVAALGVSLVGVFWLQGALVKAVEDVRDGRADMGYGETFAAAQPYLGRIIGGGLLFGLAVAIGFLLLIVPGLFLMTIGAVWVPALIFEDRRVPESFRRSYELVQPHLANVFGMLLIAFVVQIGVGLLVSLILLPLGDAAADFISELVAGVVVGPWFAVALTLLYYRLRQPAGTLPSDAV